MPCETGRLSGPLKAIGLPARPKTPRYNGSQLNPHPTRLAECNIRHYLSEGPE